MYETTKSAKVVEFNFEMDAQNTNGASKKQTMNVIIISL